MATFKIYFLCLLGAMILQETYHNCKFFAKEGLELKDILKT